VSNETKMQHSPSGTYIIELLSLNKTILISQSLAMRVFNQGLTHWVIAAQDQITKSNEIFLPVATPFNLSKYSAMIISDAM
jgi:hypothetical protein